MHTLRCITSEDVFIAFWAFAFLLLWRPGELVKKKGKKNRKRHVCVCTSRRAYTAEGLKDGDTHQK